MLHLCADTLSCWRATVAELDESLAITQLLTALRKVVGFEELANELAQSHGTFDKTQCSLYYMLHVYSGAPPKGHPKIWIYLCVRDILLCPKYGNEDTSLCPQGVPPYTTATV